MNLLFTLIPYLLLLGMVLVTLILLRFDLAVATFGWSLMRWAIRIILIGGAYLGWRLIDSQARPLWWYSWLGFATYEIIGIALLALFFLVPKMTQLSSLLAMVGLLLAVLAFLPYVIVAIRVGQRDQRLAQFTLFPHAALTAPLFFLAVGDSLNPTLDTSMIRVMVLPLLVTGSIIALLLWLQQALNRPSLYSAMIIGQCAFALSLALDSHEPMIMIGAIPLIMLGAFILTAPLLLVPIWHFSLEFIQRLGGGASLQRLAQGQEALWRRLAPPPVAPLATAIDPVDRSSVSSTIQQQAGGFFMSETTLAPQPTSALPAPGVGPGLERLYKMAIVLLAAVIIAGLLLFVGRSTVYKIHEYERGLHLRGGRFLAVQGPGWHVQIPLVDTVIIVKVNERLGYIERIEAMTSDNVTMFVSLQYTYRVTNPEQYALQVDDPERIVFEFVQGRLRDVVNTKAMAAVMNDRALMNEQVMSALKEKEDQYGVQFVTVQMQSASPPDEVLSAIKDRMVASQRQEQAQAEAAQQKTVADAEFYSAQKRAEAAAYEITKTAEAEAERIRLNTEVQQLSIRSIMGELEDKGELANKFIDYLIAQELKNNSKWVINGDGTPIVDLK